jgi:hypothetical protein
MQVGNPAVNVDWLILADAAQVTGGKLYLLGGGWDVLNVNQLFPVTRHCGVAAAFTVPWDQTNMRHNVEIEIQDDDGNDLAKIQGQFEVGRPPGIPVGMTQRTQIAAEMALTFKKPGNYVIIARIEGIESRRVHFRVAGGKALQLPPGALEP